jgi:hypothetical protein
MARGHAEGELDLRVPGSRVAIAVLALFLQQFAFAHQMNSKGFFVQRSFLTRTSQISFFSQIQIPWLFPPVNN